MKFYEKNKLLEFTGSDWKFSKSGNSNLAYGQRPTTKSGIARTIAHKRGIVERERAREREREREGAPQREKGGECV